MDLKIKKKTNSTKFSLLNEFLQQLVHTHIFCCTIYYFFNFQTIVHHTNAFTYISLLTIVDLHSPISQIDIKNYHHSGGNPTN